MARPLALVIALSISSFPTAQGITRDVPSNTPGSGTCSVVPFGDVNTNTPVAKQRLQWIVTAAELGGTAGFITGLSFAPCATGTYQGDAMDVYVAEMPPGFSFAGHLDFDDNLFLQSISLPQVVDQWAYPRWTKTANAWSSIGFDASYYYSGTNDLLIDVIVQGNHATNGTSAVHHFARTGLHTQGWGGFIPQFGSLVSSVPKVRVQFECADKTVYGQGCYNLALGVSGNPTVGGTVTVSATGSGANLPMILNLGVGELIWDLSTMGFSPCWLFADLSLGNITTAANGAGSANVPLVIPTDPNLQGGRIFAQFVQLNPAIPTLLVTSNGGRIVFGPVCP